MAENPPVNAVEAGDAGSIYGSGRSSGGGNATHSSILARTTPQRSLVGYSPWDHEESNTTEQLSAHALYKSDST